MMNVQDWSEDSGDDPNYEFSDHSMISDTDESYSETDEDEVVQNINMDDWEVLSDPFSDQLPRPPRDFSSEYDFHPAIDFEECKDPVNCFECFVSPNIVAKLCDWTNKRAENYFQQNNTVKIYGVQWKKIEKEEMYVFIALHFLTGLVKCPRITDYWSNNILCAGPQVFHKSVMSRNRYLSILRFIRFSPPEAARASAPLSRLGIYMAMLRDNCMTLVDPGPVFAVDEHLMLYKGRLHFRQFIKTKRSRFGIKIFALCPSAPHLRGYTWNFCLYTGKDTYDVSHIQGTENLSISERIVVYLAQNVLNNGREVILDNWYTSLRLAQFLLTQGTYLTGTIRSNRGVPAQLPKIPLETYQSCFVRKDMQLLVRYKDKKDVYLLTSKYTAGFYEKNRYMVGGKLVNFKKPAHIEFYNQNMGAVDAVDQDLEPYNSLRKSYTWFVKVGFHLMLQMLLNSKVIYTKAKGDSQIAMYEYIKLCCNGILRKYSEGYRKMAGGCPGDPRPSTLKETRDEHVMVNLPKEEGKNRALRKVCAICRRNNRRKLTRNICNDCPDKPGLCCREHFKEYHK